MAQPFIFLMKSIWSWKKWYWKLSETILKGRKTWSKNYDQIPYFIIWSRWSIVVVYASQPTTPGKQADRDLLTNVTADGAGKDKNEGTRACCSTHTCNTTQTQGRVCWIEDNRVPFVVYLETTKLWFSYLVYSCTKSISPKNLQSSSIFITTIRLVITLFSLD